MHKFKKTVIKLADGRDLIYFDDNEEYVTGKKVRCTKDERPLRNRFECFYNGDGSVKKENIPQMRYDILLGEWIPMASHRMNRTFMPAADANPLAPKKTGAKYCDGEIPDVDYDVVVFENRFPSLLQIPGVAESDVDVINVDNENEIKNNDNLDNFFITRPADGRCEVICFGPKIDETLAQMSHKRMRTIIEAWADRTENLMLLPNVKQVFCFENHGEAIGVTLQHPHGQIYAYPYVTARMEKMAANAKKYVSETSENLFERMLKEYLHHQRDLIIYETDKWVLYVPYAAKWPVQMHLMPKRHVCYFYDLNEEEKAELADIYLRMLKAGNKFFQYPDGSYVDLPYISSWIQAPKNDKNIRLFCDFFSFQRSIDKLKYLAGSESGMHAWISDTTPEKIAARIKEVFNDK